MRIWALLLLPVMVLVLTSCWDLKELEELALVTALGFDSGPGEKDLTLTVEHALPQQAASGGGGGGMTGGGGATRPDSLFHQASGKTLSAAVDQLQQIMERRVFFSYAGVIVIGEEAARNNMRQILDFIERAPDIRRSAFVLITPGRAGDLMATINPHAITLDQTIRGLLTETEWTGVALPTRVGDNIFEPLAINGIEPIATRIAVHPIPPEHGGQPGFGGGGEVAGGGEPAEGGIHGAKSLPQKPAEHRISGMAVFRKDRLVGWLNEQESRGWAWIRGRARLGHVVVLTPRSSRGDLDPVTFRLDGGKPSVRISLEDDQPAVHLTIKAQGEISEWATSRDLIDPGIISSLEADIAAEIKGEVEAALKKAQWELESDIFGFGFELFRQHRREWNLGFKDIWPEIFPQLPVDVTVKVQILNTGTIIRALKIKP